MYTTKPPMNWRLSKNGVQMLKSVLLALISAKFASQDRLSGPWIHNIVLSDKSRMSLKPLTIRRLVRIRSGPLHWILAKRLLISDSLWPGSHIWNQSLAAACLVGGTTLLLGAFKGSGGVSSRILRWPATLRGTGEAVRRTMSTSLRIRADLISLIWSKNLRSTMGLSKR